MEEATCVVHIDLPEFLILRQPFREEKLERVWKEKAEPPSGFTTSIKTEIEEKGIIVQTFPEERGEKEVGQETERAAGSTTGSIMGASASLQPSECRSSTWWTAKAEVVVHETEPEASSIITVLDPLGTMPLKQHDALEQNDASEPHRTFEEEREDTSCTLDESEDSTTLKEDESPSEKREDDDSSHNEDNDGNSSTESSEEWETPLLGPKPWLRFATLVSEIEPWNVRVWRGLVSPVGLWGGLSVLSWGSLFPTRDHVCCSIIYASVMLRGYRRKFFRQVRVATQRWVIIPKCPKRDRHHQVGPSVMQDL